MGVRTKGDGRFGLTGHRLPSTAPHAAVWLRRDLSGRRSESRLSQRRGTECQHPFGRTDRTKTRPKRTNASDDCPSTQPIHCDCCAISASCLFLLPLLLHLVSIVQEGSCMSQKTAGTSVTSLSNSQSFQRPSQIKTVVTIPRMLLFEGLRNFIRSTFYFLRSVGER